MFVIDHHAMPGTRNPLANCARVAAWYTTKVPGGGMENEGDAKSV